VVQPPHCRPHSSTIGPRGCTTRRLAEHKSERSSQKLLLVRVSDSQALSAAESWHREAAEKQNEASKQVAAAAGRARRARRESKAVAALTTRSCHSPQPFEHRIFSSSSSRLERWTLRGVRYWRRAGRFRPRCSMCFRWHATGGTATSFSPAFVCVRRVQVAVVETWKTCSAEEPSCREADTSWANRAST
jgi:hypothetical protein